MGNTLVIPRKRLPCFLSIDESSIIGKYDKRAAPPTKKIGDREKSSRADGADSDLAIWALMQREWTRFRRKKSATFAQWTALVCGNDGGSVWESVQVTLDFCVTEFRLGYRGDRSYDCSQFGMMLWCLRENLHTRIWRFIFAHICDELDLTFLYNFLLIFNSVGSINHPFVPILTKGNTVMQMKRYEKQIFHFAIKLWGKLINIYSNKCTYTRKNAKINLLTYLFNEPSKSKENHRTRRSIQNRHRQYPRFRSDSPRRKLFFSILPAIFAPECCARGVTDLWPVSRCHVDRLFLSRRKMHSLPFERNTAEKSVRTRRGAREEEKDGTAELKTERIVVVVVVVVVDARWKNLFRNGHMSRSRKAASSSSPSPTSFSNSSTLTQKSFIYSPVWNM